MVTNINRCFGCLFYKTLKIIDFHELTREYSGHVNKTLVIDEDTLDEFTSQLLQKKTDKWNTNKTVLKFINNSKPLEKCKKQKIKPFNVETINICFQEAIEDGDNNLIMGLIENCIRTKLCPTLSNLTYVLALCARNGDTVNITEICKLCNEVQPNILLENSDFKHYLAEAMFIKGNIDTSLKLFRDVYEKSPFIRRRLRLMFKYLIDVELFDRGEAAMVNFVKFCESLAKDYNDFYPLSCIWQQCFLSEWYTDQSLSLELLRRNDGLCEAVTSSVPYVVRSSLRRNRTDVVYRLLELFLKYEMITQYSAVLLSLLDYQIHRGDIRSSLEIIRWSLEHNVELSPIQNENFLKILLSHSPVDNTIKDKLGTTKKTKISPLFKF